MYSIEFPWELDTGSRAYILAVYSDLFPTVICPSAIIYGAPTIRRKMARYWGNSRHENNTSIRRRRDTV